MLSEINQTLKNILCFHFYEIPRIGKFTETKKIRNREAGTELLLN